MTLLKLNNPKNPMQLFNDYMDDFFGNDLMMRTSKMYSAVPPVNVKETNSNFQLELAVPGKKKEDFKITLNENMLTISSEFVKSEEEKNEKFTRKEFIQSSFSRTFTLPDNVNASEIGAEYNNGILKIVLPKQMAQPKAEQKEISIK